MIAKPKILIAIRESLYRDLIGVENEGRLRQSGSLTFAARDENLTSAQLAQEIPGVDIVITGWGTPIFTDEVMAAAGRLKLIAHSAGTIKRMLPLPVFEHGTRVTHAAAALAPPVGETTLLLILLSLRRFHQIDRAFKTEGWAAARSFELGRN